MGAGALPQHVFERDGPSMFLQQVAKGFIRQEDIPLESFLANRFGKVYRQLSQDMRAA